MAPRPAPPPASLAVLRAALTWTHGVLQHARTAPTAAPTPCEQWDLRALLVHMEDALAALGEAAVGRVAVDVAPVVEGPAPVLVDQVCRRARAVSAAWEARVTSAPVTVGDLRLGRDTLALVGAVEVVAHGWDVARAVGCDWDVPADLAARLLPVATATVGDDERGRRFAAPVAPGATATTGDRLLAHLGRDPRWRAGGVRASA